MTAGSRRRPFPRGRSSARAPFHWDTQRLLLDRLRYLSGRDSAYLNRVVIGSTAKVRADVEALQVQRGDTLRVTTTFDSLVRGGGYELYIPRWAANEGRCWDGAWVSLHTIESVAAPTP